MEYCRGFISGKILEFIRNMIQIFCWHKKRDEFNSSLFLLLLSLDWFATQSRIINHPLCGCGNESYTKKSPCLSIMQVFKPHYMQKKGDFIWQQRHRALRTQNGYANTTQYLHLSIDVKLLYNQYRNSLREILRRLCEYKGVKIIEGELMADHVHMLVLIPPKISVSSFMGYLG